MGRREADAVLLDTTLWPKVIQVESDPGGTTSIHRKAAALTAYAAWEKLESVSLRTGVPKQEITRLFNRAITTHPDGNLWGFRVCIPYQRVKAYERTKRIPKERGTQGGYAGELNRFLETHPIVEVGLRDFLSHYLKVNRRAPNTKDFHSRFMQLSRELKLGPVDYPFCVVSHGRRSLDRLHALWISEIAKTKPAAIYPSEAITKLGSGNKRRTEFCLPYDLTSFDGHLIHALFCILVLNKNGYLVPKILERIWLLIIREVATGAILGYHVCFSQYTVDDVLACIENAIQPWKPKQLTIPGLSYEEGAGFPSGCIPGLEFACWRNFRADNFKSNISPKVTAALEACGVQVGFTQAGTPDSNDPSESFFNTLERCGFHKAPNSTGSHPKDPKRRNPEKAAVEYTMTYDELLEVLDVMLANGNLGRSDSQNPLQTLKEGLAEKRYFVQQIPETNRDLLALRYVSKRVRITGDIGKNNPIHVNLLGKKYTSPALRICQGLRNTTGTVRYLRGDLRRALLFLNDGSEFGFIEAPGGWNVTKHDHTMRRAIMAAEKSGDYNSDGRSDVVLDYIEQLSKRASTRKKDRNKLAHALTAAGVNAVSAQTVRKTTPHIAALANVPAISASRRAINI